MCDGISDVCSADLRPHLGPPPRPADPRRRSRTLRLGLGLGAGVRRERTRTTAHARAPLRRCEPTLSPSLRGAEPAAQSRKCDEQTHPKRVIPAGAKRSAVTYHYPFEHPCSFPIPVGPGAARLRRLFRIMLSTERPVDSSEEHTPKLHHIIRI